MRPRHSLVLLVSTLLPLAALLGPGSAAALPGEVLGETKVSDLAGGFGGTLVDEDRFGSAAAPLGDLDGDGVGDVAVGALFDDDGGSDRGAVWILFLNADGTVKSEQKISDLDGGFGGTLADSDEFGAAVASLGDLDGDGIVDIAVGAPRDAGGGSNRGAIWILNLDTDGTVKGEQKIASATGGFGGTLVNGDLFGSSLARIDDLDGDGVDDLASGAVGDGDGGLLQGAVWILFMNANGTVKSEQKISDLDGGFEGTLALFDQFGWSLAALDDLDADGIDDLAVGSAVGLNGGAIWILFLDSDGTVQSETEIADGVGGFGGAPGELGWSLALLDDLNGDGVRDLAAGAASSDAGGSNRGALWILFMASDGFVVGERMISSISGGLVGPLSDEDDFGFSVGSLVGTGGSTDLAVGAYRDGDGGTNRGAVWMLELERDAQAVPALGAPALLALAAGLGAVGSRFASRRTSRGAPAPR